MEKEGVPTLETLGLGVITGHLVFPAHLIQSRLCLEVQVSSHEDLNPLFACPSHHYPPPSP